ncbi:MAG: class II glutamine amidotransferase [Porphyrobacter sp.]|nr:class II glutamine amidotransferase [Porphyrobacter sp.]
MCELFAVSGDRPVVLRYQLRVFARHGGIEFRNRDGWGIMFAQEHDAYLFKEPAAASESPLERMVTAHAPPSRLVMAHIRLATAGGALLANTHPFRRERYGRVLHFAHNGSLPGLRSRYAKTEIAANCIGDTDSELAFLLLLDRLRALEPAATPEQRFAVFRDFCAEMREEGSANFLFADGEILFVHAHKRRYLENGVFGESRAPGLHMREVTGREGSWSTEGAQMEATPEHGVLVASVPLDRKKWTGLNEGTTLLIEHGRVRCSG